MYKRILVPTDGSDISRMAIRSAVELACAMHAELVALHVVPCQQASALVGGVPIEPDELGRMEREATELGHAVAGEVGVAADRAGVRNRAFIVRSDHVADAILAAVRKHGCDLVVMASHGRTGLRRLLLGSETDHVLAASAVPVLVLH